MKAFPSVFISHGAPTFAIEPGRAGAQLRALGHALGNPEGIVIVSPHWMTRGLEITASDSPETIHDFGGFPAALYDIQYAAPGAPALAARAARLLELRNASATLHPTRGLDHGAWVPLMHMYPDADVPVIQVSLPFSSTPEQAYALGQALAPLGGEGVLVIGSGSLTHNLREFSMGNTAVAEYAQTFTRWVRNAVQHGDSDRLLHALERAPNAQRAHPTSEHFLPLLVAAGAAKDASSVTVLDGGIRHGVLAMESYVFGQSIALPIEEEEEQHA